MSKSNNVTSIMGAIHRGENIAVTDESRWDECINASVLSFLREKFSVAFINAQSTEELELLKGLVVSIGIGSTDPSDGVHSKSVTRALNVIDETIRAIVYASHEDEGAMEWHAHLSSVWEQLREGTMSVADAEHDLGIRLS